MTKGRMNTSVAILLKMTITSDAVRPGSFGKEHLRRYRHSKRDLKEHNSLYLLAPMQIVREK